MQILLVSEQACERFPYQLIGSLKILHRHGSWDMRGSQGKMPAGLFPSTRMETPRWMLLVCLRQLQSATALSGINTLKRCTFDFALILPGQVLLPRYTHQELHHCIVIVTQHYQGRVYFLRPRVLSLEVRELHHTCGLLGSENRARDPAECQIFGIASGSCCTTKRGACEMWLAVLGSISVLTLILAF